MKDFDSGCSSVSSSPSNLSDFSGSSMDDFYDDVLLSKRDALEMGKSALEGGPVINPFIKIKIDDDDDSSCFDDLAPANDDLLGMFLNNDELLRADICLFDDDVHDTNEFDQGIVTIEHKEIKQAETTILQEQSPSKSKSRKRTYLGKKPDCDHTYACNKDNPDSTSVETTASKDDKYLEKRRKNNLAARKSREIKRAKEIGSLKKFEKLSKENDRLQKELKKLQTVVTKLEVKLKHS